MIEFQYLYQKKIQSGCFNYTTFAIKEFQPTYSSFYKNYAFVSGNYKILL